MGRRFLCQIIEVDCAVAVACLAGRWVIHYAYLERGCAAVGSEWLVILMVYWVTYKAAHKFLNFLGMRTGSGESRERDSERNGGMRRWG